MVTPAESAKQYLELGWSPIRVHGLRADGTGCTCSKGADCKSAGKHPTDDGWQDQGIQSPEGADEAFAGWRASNNVGIRTGRPSGFFVLDVDPDNGGFDSIKQLQADHDRLPATVTQKTGSGGYHLLFQMPEDFEPTNRRGGLKEYPGLDIRGTGGQIVAAPSVSGKGAYHWMSELQGAWIAEAPAWLLDLLRPKVTETPVAPAAPVSLEGIDDEEQLRLEAYSARVRDLEVGRLVAMQEAAGQQPYTGEPWNQTTFDVACSLIELANSPWTLYDIAQAIKDVYAHAPQDDGFGVDEVDKCWRSAVNKVGDNARPLPAAQPKTADTVASWLTEPGVRVDPLLLKGQPAPAGVVVEAEPMPEATKPQRTWDDLGNAMRIVDHFGGVLRWVTEPQQWALFKQGRWELVQPNVVQGLIQRMIDELVMATEGLHYSDIPDDPDKPEDTERAGFRKWLKAQRMSPRIAAAQKEAQARWELHASRTDFDAHPLLLNCTNGVVDLRTGELLPHDPRLLLMGQVTVAYDPTAAAPEWMAFLERVQPDPQVQSYLQRISGYGITGDTREQALFIHYGQGANGKSVYSDTIKSILGEYGRVIHSSTLLSGDRDEHPTGVADMAGRRWLMASETKAGKRLDEEKVKNLTGDSTVTARFMAKDFFEYTPTGKINLVTNHLPRLSGSHSIMRRMHLIKWGVQIPKPEWDLQLGYRIRENELPGVLAWLVRGTQAWLAQGLNPPARALTDLEEYREDSDNFGDFLQSCTMPAPDHRTPTSSLYQAYQAWVFRQGQKAMTMPGFTAAMVERGYERYRDARGRGFVGLIAVAQQAQVPWEETA